MVSEYLTRSRRSVERVRIDAGVALDRGRGTLSARPEWPRIVSHLHGTAVRLAGPAQDSLGPARAAAPEIASAGLQILVAEDNGPSQVIMKVFLESAGHRADIAANGIEVMYALGERTYDVILMDLAMPGVGGIEVCRQIRDLQSDACEIPIIAVTAQAHDQSREKCLRAGMNEFVTKPFGREELCEAIDRCAREASRLKLSA